MTELDFEMWGRQAATEYLMKDIPLNDSITKIAERESLNYEQMRRIVEEANNQVYLRKFSSPAVKDKYIEFPVADAREISATLNENASYTPSVGYDYTSIPNESFSSSFKRLVNIKEAADNEYPTSGEKTKLLFTAQGIASQFEDRMNLFVSGF